MAKHSAIGDGIVAIFKTTQSNLIFGVLLIIGSTFVGMMFYSLDAYEFEGGTALSQF